MLSCHIPRYQKIRRNKSQKTITKNYLGNIRILAKKDQVRSIHLGIKLQGPAHRNFVHRRIYI